ncbi:MAG: DNA replication and repair protein RecF [Flavobacteriales bacterium]|nr:DNA replication and repair protein RecF [Flavobacteriales bacterium]|tara:strand:- start:700 stop:1806 length:1107 start_codon:yes stop_codon:yes gene_type:complete
MILKFLSIINFKNHENTSLKFDENINCIVGPNGVGKTNLLDSIHYLSFSKSYFNSIESFNIKEKENYFMIKGEFFNQEKQELDINCSYTNKKKVLKFNNKKYDKLSNHIGKIPLIIITPIDSNLINGSGEIRRKFIDKFLSQIDSSYLESLLFYNKTLNQRNALLKNSHNTNDYIDLLNTYDDSLAEFGTQIFNKRRDYISSIIKTVKKYYNIISNDREDIDVEYYSELQNNSFKNLLKENLQKDLVLQFTSSGIHRDDFIFKMKETNIKKTGSQGQQKSFLISLKLANFDLLYTKTNEKPILLLDDVFDKLDDNRVEQIMTILNSDNFGQIFITDTSFNRINSVMSTAKISCKYFLYNFNGTYHEKT